MFINCPSPQPLYESPLLAEDHHQYHRQQQLHEESEPPATPPPLVQDITPEKKKKSKKDKKRKDRDRQRRTPSSSPVRTATTSNFVETQDAELRNVEEDFGGTNILISVPHYVNIANFEYFHRCSFL